MHLFFDILAVLCFILFILFFAITFVTISCANQAYRKHEIWRMRKAVSAGISTTMISLSYLVAFIILRVIASSY